jgi:hypothetical protein
VTRRLAAIGLLLGCGLLTLPAPALAAFPGEEGKIAYSDFGGNDLEIYIMNGDGSDRAPITNNSTGELNPRWSADGKKIVYQTDRDGDYEIFVMNADGSGETRITNNSVDDFNPAWSPYGTRIAFVSNRDGNREIYLIDTDGTNETRLTNNTARDVDPVWSPLGTKIVFASDRAFRGYEGIYTMNTDGSGVTHLPSAEQHVGCNVNTAQYSPDWSPDGQRVAFVDYEDGDPECLESWWHGINTIKADGTNENVIAAEEAGSGMYSPTYSPVGAIAYGCDEGFLCTSYGTHVPNGPGDMDWQPIIANPPGYARPKGAHPTQVRLVPAYAPCTSPNAEHGPPLAVGSCRPVQPASSYLTVGTFDANGAAPNSVGYVNFRYVCNPPAPNPTGLCTDPGEQADVELTASVTDVRNQPNLTDYAGELRVQTTLRVTDRLNLPAGITPATTIDSPFGFTMTCLPTASDSIGSTCSAATHADAVMPGIVLEDKRSVWQLSKVQVYDGGADGDADTAGDNTLFMEQGLFAP